MKKWVNFTPTELSNMVVSHWIEWTEIILKHFKKYLLSCKTYHSIYYLGLRWKTRYLTISLFYEGS